MISLYYRQVTKRHEMRLAMLGPRICQILFCTLPLAAFAQTESLFATTSRDQNNSDWIMPRTEHGHPDFQGIWLFGSRTPLQRPAQLGNKQTYSEQEVVELERTMRERNARMDDPLDANRAAPERGARIGQEADDGFLAHYREPELVKVNGEYRTSVIVDPVDGRYPLREGFKDFTAMRRAAGLGDTDGPEGQPLSGRCITFGAAVPSLTPIMMNPNMQIIQNRDYVVIVTEMIHDARIVRLDAEHFSHGIRNWMGDSVGRWDGDTLVVHTRNFRPEQSSPMFIPHSEDLELVERYTLTGDNEIHYSFTASDAQAFTQTVTGERTLTRNSPEQRIYEFACHEGNYSLSSILAGARRQDVESN
jgi:hypothetical protein